MTPIKQKQRFNRAGENTKKSQENFRVFSAEGGFFRDEKKS